ncbi:MAG: peptidoglycan editing factor PgeF [Patescibacteria group bacterium]
MSLKEDGNMKLRGEQSSAHAFENRKKFYKENNILHENVIGACVEHTNNVSVVNKDSERLVPNTDGLVTTEKNIYLAVTSADCFPVLLYDKKNGVIGIAHAGWRGIIKEIVPHTINKMVRNGAKEKDIFVTVGPGISQDHFDFEFREMISKFGLYNQDRYVIAGSTLDKVKIDLRKIIADQLVKFGIRRNNIHDCGMCTFARENEFFSARREGRDFSVMMSVIGMKA